MTKTIEDVKAVADSYHNGTKTIEEAVTEALVEARATCETNGNGSPECAVAWDIVEELSAERADQKTEATVNKKSSLESYCDMNPEAIECLIYDV